MGFSLLGTVTARRPVCLWPASRVALSSCTSGAAGEGRVACGGQAKPYRLPGPCGAGTPGSRWRGNPGLWKSSPSGNVRNGEVELGLGDSTSQLTLGRSPGLWLGWIRVRGALGSGSPWGNVRGGVVSGPGGGVWRK